MEQCREMLLSFRLLEGEEWSDDRVISCLYAVSNHVEKHYTRIRIPKKNGGFRELLAPDPLLKTIQRNILHHVLEGFTVSSRATAYRKGTAIRDNAAPHTGKRLLLKMDIHDFFGSISFSMVHQSAFPGKYFPPSVGTMLTALCCCHEYLPQGSPASPAISNLVMRPFDDYMDKWCGEREIVYTRYCDDMTFSGDFDVKEVFLKVRGFLEAMGFELNPSKTKVLTRGSRQTVTGIVVNETLKVPSAYRRSLKQEIYYCMKYGVWEHLKRTGRQMEPEKREVEERKYLLSLLGRVSFVLSVNPEDTWFANAKEMLEQAVESI